MLSQAMHDLAGSTLRPLAFRRARRSAAALGMAFASVRVWRRQYVDLGSALSLISQGTFDRIR